MLVWKRMGQILIGLLVTMALSLVAFAEGPMPEVDPKAATDALTGGISSGAWVLIVAGGGLLAVWLLRLLLLPKMKGKALAWVSTGLIAVAGALGPLSTGVSIVESIMAGLAAGFAAGKAWDLLPDSIKDKAKAPIKKKRGD